MFRKQLFLRHFSPLGVISLRRSTTAAYLIDEIIKNKACIAVSLDLDVTVAKGCPKNHNNRLVSDDIYRKSLTCDRASPCESPRSRGYRVPFPSSPTAATLQACLATRRRLMAPTPNWTKYPTRPYPWRWHHWVRPRTPDALPLQNALSSIRCWKHWFQWKIHC